MKEHYRKDCFQKLLALGGFGSGFSKVIAEKIHSLSFEEVAKDIQGDKIMLLQGEIQGENIPELVADFMQKCADPVAGVEKAEQVSKELLDTPKNKSIMIRMDAGAAVPDPATWLAARPTIYTRTKEQRLGSLASRLTRRSSAHTCFRCLQ